MTIYYKTCIKCNLSKPSFDFYKHPGKDGLQSKCKECAKSYSKTRYDAKHDEIRAQVKESYYDNHDLMLARQAADRQSWSTEKTEQKKEYLKIYNLLNKDAIKEKRQRKKEIYRNSEEYKAKERIKQEKRLLRKFATGVRSLIGGSFKYKGHRKTSKTTDILGCSISEFKVYIESQFSEGMTWENRSEWHLDHIKPVSLGDSEDEIIALNHYTNFQPLWALDNILKSNNYEE